MVDQVSASESAALARAQGDGDGRLEIAPSLRADLLTEAANAYPREACGILLGRLEGDTRVAEELRATPNLWPDRGDRYRVDPEALRQALVDEDAGGARVLGFYHSHPDGPPVPSETDRELAWPWYYYVIVVILMGVPGKTRAWELDPESGRFVERRIADS